MPLRYLVLAAALLVMVTGRGFAIRSAGEVTRTPPLIVVDGSELPATDGAPTLEDGEWWLQAEPVCAALRMELGFDAVSSQVELTDPMEVVVRRYDGLSGQLTRDDVTQFFLPAGLVQGTEVRDLRLPLTVLAGLLDVEVWISPQLDQISLTPRGSARRISTESTRGWRLRELRYRGSGNRYGDQDRGDLNLETRSEVGTGDLRTALGVQASSSDAPSFRTGRATWADEGRRIQAGDVGTSGLSWQRISGRGLDWTEEFGRGKRRVSASAVQQLSPSSSSGGALGTPEFDPWALSLSIRTGALPGAPVGKSFGLGVTWVERYSGSTPDRSAAGDDEETVLVSNEVYFARSWARIAARGGTVVGSGMRPDHGWEIDAALSPLPSVQLQAGAAEFGHDFAPPNRSSVAGSARRSIGATWSPLSRLSLRTYHSRQRSVLETNTDVAPDDPTDLPGLGDTEGLREVGSGDPARMYIQPSGTPVSGTDDGASPARPGRSEYTTANAGFTLPTQWFRTMSLGATWSQPSGRDRTSRLSSSARGQIRQLGWFWNGRHPTDDPGESHVLTSGLSWNGSRLGRLQVVHTWSDDVPAGGSWLWSPKSLSNGRVQASLGQNWARGRTGTDFRPFLRVRWSFHSDHGLDLSLHESGDQLSARLSIRGAWGFGGRNAGNVSPRVPGYQRHLGEVEGRLYLDHDMDGLFGPGDRPLRGVRVRLDRGRRTTETDETGVFRFLDVTAGTHRVAVDPGTIRADYVLLDPMRREVVTAAFERQHVDFRVGINRKIEGRVFYDRNGNQRWDEGELAAAEIHIVMAGGQDTLTYPDGTFRIGDIPPGRRILRIDDSSLAADYRGPGSISVLVPPDRDPEPLLVPLQIREDRIVRKQF